MILLFSFTGYTRTWNKLKIERLLLSKSLLQKLEEIESLSKITVM